MLRVVTVLPGNQHEAGILRMHEFPVAAFAAVNPYKPRPFEIGDQLANFAWHTPKTATTPTLLPASIPPQFRRTENIAGFNRRYNTDERRFNSPRKNTENAKNGARQSPARPCTPPLEWESVPRWKGKREAGNEERGTESPLTPPSPIRGAREKNQRLKIFALLAFFRGGFIRVHPCPSVSIRG